MRIGLIITSFLLASCSFTSETKQTPASSDLSGVVPLTVEASGVSCKDYLVLGYPKNADQILCRDGFAVGYSYQKKIPLWVIYSITEESVSTDGGDRKKSNYTIDIELPEQYRSTPDDYDEPNFDVGHMANAADVDFSQKSVDQSFLMSNMTPQIAEFNRCMMGMTGAWGCLENKVRSWIKKRKKLYIIAGAIDVDDSNQIGDGVAVPETFYKVIYDPVKKEALAFLMPQDKNTGKNLAQYLVSIDEIEAVAEINLMDKLPKPLQTSLERSLSEVLW